MGKVVKFRSRKPFLGRRKNRNLRTKVATVVREHDQPSLDVSTATGVQNQCDISPRPSSSQSESKMNFFGIDLDISTAAETS